jgi:hypothetical protein
MIEMLAAKPGIALPVMWAVAGAYAVLVVLAACLAVPIQFWLAYRAEFGLFMVFIQV